MNTSTTVGMLAEIRVLSNATVIMINPMPVRLFVRRAWDIVTVVSAIVPHVR